ncbi:M48 family metallopeptidase [Brumimicrobium mesophilum]|uniref:M48 family metallopeptidase n=1 Tax=Brumimicrobium mesophilum TaxID=392717 RepID=UPI000D1442A9|nr:M48 family metallopeptidase [Brumimicrobium mesophilum]
MKKILAQGSIIILLFLGAWFGLNQIDWVKIFKVEKITNKTEEKLGEFFLETFENSEEEIQNIHLLNSIDTIVNHICSSNNIDRESIKFHVFNNPEINAFALPDGHLIINSGLILNSDNQEELIGVICHEIAHIELNHVMKKLIKEVGLSTLISMTTGNSGAVILKETAGMLSSSAFDRTLEKDADLKAVEYLINANLNPEPFANFLYKLSDNEHEASEYLTWISTHPDSKERAEYVLEHSKNQSIYYESVLSSSTWEKMKIELNE